MVWKDHQDLGVFQGRAERALGREGGRAAGGLASRVFGLIPGGAEVAWQALKVREPDSPGQAVHSSLGGVMRKGMVRNIPGGLCRLQIDDREPSTSQLESSASPLTQGRYAAGASEAEISLGVDVSATLNGLVDFTKFQTCFQIQYHYWFANNTMKKTEIAENYSCPFCVQRHPSFEALKCHLLLCHDLFHYSFHGRGGIGSSVNLTTDPLVHDKEGRLMLPEAEVYRANNINKEFFFFRGREKKVRGVPAPVTIRDVERYKYELAYVRKRRSAPAAPTNEVGADRGKRKIRFLEEDEVVGRKRKVQRLQQRSNNGVGGGGAPAAQVPRRPHTPGGRAPGRPARCLSPGRLPLAGASEKADPPAAAWTPPSPLAAPRRGRMPPVHSRSARPYRTPPRSSGGLGALVTTTCAGRGASVRRLAAARCGTGGGGVLGAECSPRCLHNCRM